MEFSFYRLILHTYRKEITRYRCNIETSSQTSMEHAKISSFSQFLEVFENNFYYLHFNRKYKEKLCGAPHQVLP